MILKHGTPQFRQYTNDVVGGNSLTYSSKKKTSNGHGYAGLSEAGKNGREQGQSQYGQQDDDKKKVVCYFSNWAHERPADAAFIPENLQGVEGCTHVFYAFATLDPRSLLMAPSHRYTDVRQGYLGEGTTTTMNFKSFSSCKRQSIDPFCRILQPNDLRGPWQRDEGDFGPWWLD